VLEANVNFATTRASVLHTSEVTAEALREVVRQEGYDAILPSSEAHALEQETDAESTARAAEYAAQKRRFIFAAILSLPVVVLAMGGHIIPALEPLLHFPGSLWLQFALTTPVLFWVGAEFLTGAWSSARRRAADMNTLVAIGTLFRLGV
jgi:Cu+-exporting ATPase